MRNKGDRNSEELAMDGHVTRVIFRRWSKSQGGGIIALFLMTPTHNQGEKP